MEPSTSNEMSQSHVLPTQATFVSTQTSEISLTLEVARQRPQMLCLEHQSGLDQKDMPEAHNESTSSSDQMDGLNKFFHKLIHPKFRYIRDLYPIMFFLDVICFIFVAFNYSSFGEGGSGDVLNDLKVFFYYFWMQ